MGVLELRSIKTEMKNSVDGHNSRYELAEESVSWKMEQHKVSGLKNREKTLKKIKPQRSV